MDQTELAAEEVSRAEATYRYLRIIALIPASWLIVTLVVSSLIEGHFNDSISDYYGEPIRDVFVGALMASGVCMIAYKGRSKLEDWALNFSGLNTFFVALVPNTFQDILGDAVHPGDLVTSLRWTLGLFIVAAIVFAVVDRFVMDWKPFAFREQTGLANSAIVVSWLGEAVLILGVLRFILCGSKEFFPGLSMYTFIHFGAAILLVVNLAFAAASFSFKQMQKTDDPISSSFLKLVSGLMLLGVPGGFALFGLGCDYAIIIVELWEIVLSILFWIAATGIEWKLPDALAGVLGRASS
jgi:hypothetical protein